MIHKRHKELWDRLDLHKDKPRRLAVYMGLVVLVVLSILVRKSLIHAQNADYLIFSSWYDFAKLHGIHSFKYGYSDGFSNYNPPYTYFLYLSTLLPVSKIVAIKGMMAFFDVVLAGSVYGVMKVFRPRHYVPEIAALATMFLPTVLLNGVFWGQFDQFYVAFILFSLWAGLTGRSRWAWALFGIALSIKLQAIFFLPVLGILVFKKIKWHDFIWGIGSFLTLTVPPVLVGRSIGSLLSIYPDQAKLFNGELTLNAPNLYQWLPNSAFHALNGMGIYLTLAITVLVVLYTLLRQMFSSKNILVLTTLLLYVIPFLLPAMHERYFLAANIMSFILVFAYPSYAFITVALASQTITVLSYCPFLFGTVPISMSILALGNLVIIGILGAQYFSMPLSPVSRSSTD